MDCKYRDYASDKLNQFFSPFLVEQTDKTDKTADNKKNMKNGNVFGILIHLCYTCVHLSCQRAIQHSQERMAKTIIV